MLKNKQALYKTGVFKCKGDYDACRQGGDWKVCAALLALCITTELKILRALGAGTIGYMIGH